MPIWQVGAIGKFEGKSGVGLPGSDSVKGQHLLPFLPAFSAFVSRLQELLAGLHPTIALLSAILKACAWSAFACLSALQCLHLCQVGSQQMDA